MPSSASKWVALYTCGLGVATVEVQFTVLRPLLSSNVTHLFTRKCLGRTRLGNQAQRGHGGNDTLNHVCRKGLSLWREKRE